MQSQVDEISPVLVAVKVEVPWDAVEKDLDQAYRRVQKTAKIRGFRPGKVPRNVVKQMMGPRVRYDVANNLVQRSLGEAMDEHSIDPVAIPDVKAEDLVEGAPFVFTAQVEVRPTIAELKLDDLRAERTRVRVADEAIEKEIERLREQNGELVSPEPSRPAQSGDILTFSASLTIEGDERTDLSVDETRGHLGSGHLLPELDQGLTGMEIGSDRDIQVTFPEDFGQEDLRGKKAVFSIHLKEIQEQRIPELDDEFAKDLEYESVEGMRSSIRERMEATADQRADALVREAVLKKLVDDNPIPVPPSMISRQQQQMMQEFMQFQRYMGREGVIDAATQDEIRAEAERKVRAGLLLGQIAKNEQLAVADEEIEQELSKLAEKSGQHIAKVRAEHQGQARDNLRARLLENKLLEYLLGKATITENEVDEAPSEASQ